MYEFDDDGDQRRVLCDRCRKFSTFSDIKYLPKGDGKMALCRTCIKQFTTAPNPALKKQVSSDSSVINYFCQRCRYKFKYNTARHAILKCPYCGKDDKIMEDKIISADHLVKESHDF